MKARFFMVATTIGDLAFCTPGTRIATNDNKLLVLEDYPGGPHWFEDGELTPYSPIVEWLPAVVLSSSLNAREDL